MICLAGRSLINLCRSNGATAYGLLSTSTLTSIVSILNKLVSEELKNRSKHSKTATTDTIAPSAVQEDDVLDTSFTLDEETDELQSEPSPRYSPRTNDTALKVQSLKMYIHDLHSIAKIIHNWYVQPPRTH